MGLKPDRPPSRIKRMGTPPKKRLEVPLNHPDGGRTGD